jgi:imidazolonepropionase-like amidohydrolase
MGTDAGTPFNTFDDVAQELSYMADYGMDPSATLAAATMNAADLLGLDDVGLIEAGYVADLVVLDANPRADPTAYDDPEAVIADGRHVV